MRFSNGIALIQVLLITAMLSIFALFLLSTAKNQVKMSQWSNDKAEALVALHNTESNLLFALLTTSKSPFEQSRVNQSSLLKSEPTIKAKWNFFAKPFFIDDTTEISIQDQAGLIHAQFPNTEHLRAFISAQGVGVHEANAVVDSLLDWQDLDTIPRANGYEKSGLTRNGTIPDIHDLFFIKSMTPELLSKLIKVSTIHRKGSFNPMNSPIELLAALTNERIAKQVIELREAGQLTKRSFTQLTGINEDDNTFFYPSNFLKITLISKIGESRVYKSITIQLLPYAKNNQRPINVLSSRS
tara:strand:- start:21881 stop:22777 length:897 start_codon:yes stop_codon:yes gene_type:complete